MSRSESLGKELELFVKFIAAFMIASGSTVAYAHVDRYVIAFGVIAVLVYAILQKDLDMLEKE